MTGIDLILVFVVIVSCAISFQLGRAWEITWREWKQMKKS